MNQFRSFSSGSTSGRRPSKVLPSNEWSGAGVQDQPGRRSLSRGVAGKAVVADAGIGAGTHDHRRAEVVGQIAAEEHAAGSGVKFDGGVLGARDLDIDDPERRVIDVDPRPDRVSPRRPRF